MKESALSIGRLIGRLLHLLPLCAFLLLVTQAKAQASIGSVELSPSQSYAIVDTSAATYTVTVNKSGDGPMSAALSFNGLSNVNATFSPDTLVFGETDATLTSTLTVLPTAGSSAGTFDISVTATDESFGSASGYAQIVVKEPTTLVVKTKAGPKGANLSLVAQLFSGTNGVFGKTVYFAVDGVPVGSDVTSLEGWAGVGYTVPATFDTGSVHTITAVYANNDDPVYATSGGSASLTVWKADTSIVVTAVSGKPGDEVQLEATLEANGTGLGDKPVRFKVDGVIIGNTTTDSVTTPGKATFAYTIPVGQAFGSTMVVTAIFFGDADFWSATSTGDLSVSKAATQILVNPVTSAPGFKATFTALLETDDHTPLEGKAVDFTLDAGGPDATLLGTATTGADGRATLEAVVPTGLVIGSSHLISAAFSGATDPTYAPSSNTATLTVVRRPTAIAVASVPGPLGSSARLIATLWSGSSKVAGKELSFYVDDVLVGTAVTGAVGAAAVNYSVPVDSSMGAHSIKVVFDGSADPEYTSSEKTATLTVGKQTTAIAVASLPGALGKSASLYATLWAGSSKVSGKELSFYVDDVLVGTAVTNASGAATVPYSVANDATLGGHTIKVTFDGSADPVYTSSEKTATLTIGKQITAIAVASVSGNPGTSVPLYATLWSGSSRVAGKALSFYVDDVFVGTVTTNALGAASMPYPIAIGAEPSSLTIKVVFDGSSDPVYSSSEKTATLTKR